MKHEYLQTIERQQKWLAYSRSGKGESMWKMLPTGESKPFQSPTRDRHGNHLEHTSASRAQERGFYEEALRSPNVYHVGPEFCRLIDTARQTLPDDVNFDATWVPSDTGWMWCETPVILPSLDVHPAVELKDGSNQRKFAIQLGAFGWISGERHDTDPSEKVVTFVGFQTAAMDLSTGELVENDSDMPFFPVTYFTLVDGQNIRERVSVFEVNTNKQDDYLQYNDSDIWRHEIRWVYTALLMMDQRLLVAQKHRVDRGTRRRMEKAGREVIEDINVITLRRLANAGLTADGDPVEQDWSCHWEVKGHWRQQYHPSTQTHKPKWIFPYIKGDLEKPFRAKKRLFAAVR